MEIEATVPGEGAVAARSVGGGTVDCVEVNETETRLPVLIEGGGVDVVVDVDAGAAADDVKTPVGEMKLVDATVETTTVAEA